MQQDEPTPPHIVKSAKRLRFTGWWFLIIGSTGVLWTVAVLFDPEAAMPVNGVPRTEFHIKLAVALFAALFPALGAFLAFVPRTKIEGFLVRFDRFARSFYDAHNKRK